jgi:hypothetical protein
MGQSGTHGVPPCDVQDVIGGFLEVLLANRNNGNVNEKDNRADEGGKAGDDHGEERSATGWAPCSV